MPGPNVLDGAQTQRRRSMSRLGRVARSGLGAVLVAVLSVPDLAWAADTSPPTGTVVINGDHDAATNNRTVTLTLSATDEASAVTQMRFSNTGSSFSAAEAYATTTTRGGCRPAPEPRPSTSSSRTRPATGPRCRSPTPSCSTRRHRPSRRVPQHRSRAVPARSPGPRTNPPRRRSTTGSPPATGQPRRSIRARTSLTASCSVDSRPTRRTTTAFARATRRATNASAPTARSRPPSSIRAADRSIGEPGGGIADERRERVVDGDFQRTRDRGGHGRLRARWLGYRRGDSSVTGSGSQYVVAAAPARATAPWA